MIFLTFVPMLLALLSVEGRSKSHSSGDNKPKEYFDLSYSFSKDTIYFPGSREFSLSKDYDGVNKSGIWYSAFSFCMGEHGGTHVDAPFHFYKDGWTLDKIPPSHLIDVPAYLIDVEDYVNQDDTPEDFVLEVRHLMNRETSHGEIPFGAVLLVHTGWSKHWPDKVKYLGWDNSTSSVNFPGVSEEVAKWLADERQIIGLGIDTPSVDVGSSKTFPVHVLFGEKQIYNIENVANLHTLVRKPKISQCNLHLYVLPIKIIGATGGPTRILAYCK